MKKITSSVITALMLCLIPMQSFAYHRSINQKLHSSSKSTIYKVHNTNDVLMLKNRFRKNNSSNNNGNNENQKPDSYKLYEYYKDLEITCENGNETGKISFDFSKIDNLRSMEGGEVVLKIYRNNKIIENSSFHLSSSDEIKEDNQIINAISNDIQGDYFFEIKVEDNHTDGVIDELNGFVELYYGDMNEGPSQNLCNFKTKKAQNPLDKEEKPKEPEEQFQKEYFFSKYYKATQILCDVDNAPEDHFLSFDLSKIDPDDRNTLNGANGSVCTFIDGKKACDEFKYTSDDVLRSNSQEIKAGTSFDENYFMKYDYDFDMRAVDENDDGIVDFIKGKYNVYRGSAGGGPASATCEFVAEKYVTISLYGYVTDKKTDEGINDAYVECEITQAKGFEAPESKSIKTKSDGNFAESLKFLVPANKQFSASCWAYDYGNPPSGIGRGPFILDEDLYITDMNIEINRKA